MNGANNTTFSKSTDVFRIPPDVKNGLYFSIFFLGFFGNVLVIAVVAGKKRSRRTFQDIFMVNLAASDLALILIYFPMYSAFVFGNFHAPLMFCKLIWPLITVAFLSSVFNITSMAVHRCRVIVSPYKSNMRQKTAYIWVSSLWVLSFVFILPAMIYAEVHPSGMCYDVWPTMQIKQAFYLFMLVVQYLLPLTIIAVAYVRIGLELNQSKARKLSKQPKALSKARRRENAQVVRAIATIVILFAVCMFPKHFASMYAYFGQDSTNKMRSVLKMRHISEIFAVLHSCLNPLVYGTVMKHFRAEYMRYLRRIFCCRWSSRLSSDHAQTSRSSDTYEDRVTLSELIRHSVNITNLATLSELTFSDDKLSDVIIVNQCTEDQAKNTASTSLGFDGLESCNKNKTDVVDTRL